jgi:hypothetical protein
MCVRTKQRFPGYAARIYNRDISNPIHVDQQAVICSAVLIHLPIKTQDKILKNIREKNFKRITFDINSPSEAWLVRNRTFKHFERQIKGSVGMFRMTWQSHYAMTRKVLSMFPDYKNSIKFYKVHKTRHKVVYFLEK